MKCKFCGAEVELGAECEYCGSRAEASYYKTQPPETMAERKPRTEEKTQEVKYAPKVTGVIVKDLDGNTVGDYPSMKQAAEGLGCSVQCISAAVQRGSVVMRKYQLEAIEEIMEPRPKKKTGPKGKPCEEARPVVIPRTIHKIQGSPEARSYWANHIPYRKAGGENENIRGNQTE